MFDPANDYGEEFAVFQVPLGADGSIGSATLESGNWHAVTLKLDLSSSTCQLLVDNQTAGMTPLRNKTINGISYIRFRSAAQQIDSVGFLVDSVTVSIDSEFAPRCSAGDQIEHELRYIEKVVPEWQ